MWHLPLHHPDHGPHWEEPDVELSLPGLMAGIFDTKAWMARRAGQAMLVAKVKAALRMERRVAARGKWLVYNKQHRSVGISATKEMDQYLTLLAAAK